MKTNTTTKKIALIGVMSALVFVVSYIQIPLPNEMRIHFGNAMCLLAAFLLGPKAGGLAAGIGSAMFDLTNPLYLSSTPFTFAFKFLMAFVCGKIAWGGSTQGAVPHRNTLAGIAGSITYILLYLSRNFIRDIAFNKLELSAALIRVGQKIITSGINGVIAVIVAVPLATFIRQKLHHNNTAVL